jgi:hypothetical protein
MRRGWPTRERKRERAAEAFVARTSGRPLARGPRARMERVFDADFGDVRVHDGLPASEAAGVLSAKAFAFGDQVVLPDGERDEWLLAHELAHVLQQRRRDAAADAEPPAQDAAERAARGRSVDPRALGGAAHGLHPQDEEPKEPRREGRTEPSFTLPWGDLLGSPTFQLGPGPLLTPPLLPARGDDQQPAPSLPSRLGVLSSGRFSLGLRLGFPEAEDIPGAPPSGLKESLARAQLIDQRLSGRIPSTWEALDKGQLASAVWGVFSTHIAPDVARNLTRSLSTSRGPGGVQLQLDLVLLTDFTGGGLTFTVRH